MADDYDDYKVGPGRPPLHTDFRKGQSGNLSGRSKKKLHALLADALGVTALGPDLGGASRTRLHQSTGSRGPKASAAAISPPCAEFARRREDSAKKRALGPHGGRNRLSK
jgi:hypothetical protein